jgi:hypothetical protein
VRAGVLSAALGLVAVLVLGPVRAAGPQGPPTKPEAKKPYGDPAEGRLNRGSEMSTLYDETSRALGAEVLAAQAREAAAKRQLVVQSFTQATSGPADRRWALQSEAIRIREKLKTASGPERDALAKRVSEMLVEAKQLPAQPGRAHRP